SSASIPQCATPSWGSDAARTPERGNSRAGLCPPFNGYYTGEGKGRRPESRIGMRRQPDGMSRRARTSMSDTQTKDMAKSPPGVREGSDLAGAGRAGGGNSDGGKSGGTWIGLAVLAMLFLASIALIRKADDTKPPDWEESRLTYLPSGKILKPLAMDLDEAMAAILWIRGMLYFSGAYLQGKEYEWMGHILDIVTTLNPHFKQAYEFGGVVLTKNKAELPKTLKLLDRGI